MELIDWLTV